MKTTNNLLKVQAMDTVNLKKLQHLQLEMLMEVDRICRKHEIKYIICFGTLLGAVRHKGFVPWDDDVDIAMVRSEYEKFCRICSIELNHEKFFLQTHETDTEYRWGYGKLLKNGTTFVRYRQQHLKMRQQVYIDIFPMDGVPEGYFARKWFNAVRLICRKIMWSEVGKVCCKSAVMRGWFRLLNCISVEKVFAVLEHLSHKYNEKNSEYVTCLSFSDLWVKGYKGHKKEFFINTKEGEFEGEVVKIPIHAEEMLRASYGDDFMQPPPLEERVPHATAAYFDF